MPFGTFLDGRPYSQLRGAAWLALSDSATILAGTVVDDTGGGGTTTWTIAGTVPCRVTPLGGGETTLASRISDRSTHMIMVPPGTQIGVANRLGISARGTFEVTAVRDRTREWIRTLEAVQA